MKIEIEKIKYTTKATCLKKLISRNQNSYIFNLTKLHYSEDCISDKNLDLL